MQLSSFWPENRTYLISAVAFRVACVLKMYPKKLKKYGVQHFSFDVVQSAA
jgi:hypothetical protein